MPLLHRLDQIVTAVGLAIGFSVHLYLAYLAVAHVHLPYTLAGSSYSYTGLAFAEAAVVSRQLNLDVISTGAAALHQGDRWRNLTLLEQQTDHAVFVDRDTLKSAVDLWITNETRALELYGRHVSDWNVSTVTDMSFLFRDATNFSEDLSQWDVSLVRNMSGMFQDARQFQSNLSNWQVSNVQDFSHMFHGASSFDGDVYTWDVSSAVDYSFMFCNAVSFRGDLSTWMKDFNKDTNIYFSHGNLRRSVSEETLSFLFAQNMESMFENATLFDSDLTLWETGAVVNMRAMFRNAIHFDGGCLRYWNVSAVQDSANMFDRAATFSRQLCWKGPSSHRLLGADCTNDNDNDARKAVVSTVRTYSKELSQHWNTLSDIFATSSRQ
jgi:surface protein